MQVVTTTSVKLYCITIDNFQVKSEFNKLKFLIVVIYQFDTLQNGTQLKQIVFNKFTNTEILIQESEFSSTRKIIRKIIDQTPQQSILNLPLPSWERKTKKKRRKR